MTTPHLAAALEVLDRVVGSARRLGNDCRMGHLLPTQCEQFEHMMDVVRRIPRLLTGWEPGDVSLLRMVLAGYDARWGDALLGMYERKVAEHGGGRL